MKFEDKNSFEPQNTVLHDIDALYLAEERKRIKEAILQKPRSDPALRQIRARLWCMRRE